MNIANLFRIAFRAINNNKMRAILTMLGIIIGVASVITMLAIGQGTKESILGNIEQMGSNMITIRPGADMRGPVRQSSADMQSLKYEDYEAILKECEYVSEATPMVNTSAQVIYANNNTPTSIYGVNVSYLNIRKLEIEKGEMFTETDIKTSAKVCVIGKTVMDNLFPNGENPIGQNIRINKIPFKIVGTLVSKGDNSMGMDQDDLILAPFSAVQKRMLSINYLNSIIVSAVNEEMSDAAIEEITEVLRTKHKIKPTAENDFSIHSQQEMMEMMSSTTGMLTLLLASIASISLLVGGIGIMNIMFVSVTERTKEIGLRMSIGAKEKDILWQFLIEAILISVAGGLIGVLLGVSLAYLIEHFAHISVAIQIYTIILSFSICTIIGVFFGWYPAKKASNLDPIEALRYE